MSDYLKVSAEDNNGLWKEKTKSIHIITSLEPM